MSRSKSDSNSSCHNEADKPDEVYSGYLIKSPPSGQMKILKAWKRRFFVLAKKNDSSHELKYYQTTERDRPIKSIAVSTITQLYMRPESHSTFEWIFKNHKCSSSQVLLMKTEDDKAQREYFFIGDTSEEADRWFSALYGVMKKIKSESQTETQIMVKSNSSDQNPRDTQETTVEGRPPVPPRRKSASEGVTTQHDPCSQPSKNSPSATEVCKEMGKKETLDQIAEDSNDDASSGQSLTDSDISLLDCVTKAFNSLTQPTESTRNCASTKLNGETHTLVEKDICIRQHELKSLIFTEKAGKLCVSECRQNQDSCPFHKGDQILAFNDLLIDTVEEMRTYIRRLSKDEVKLTIRRLSDQNKTT